MKTDKVTREDLRAIHDGETRTFELPSYSAVLPDRNVIAITRMPR